MAVSPFIEKRPWGEFEEFVKSAPVTVKLIFIKQGEALSLQKHHHRSEFWKVVKGNPHLEIAGEHFDALEGDEFTVPVEAEHRLSAPVNEVEILEIAEGKFDEGDIVRLEDKYGR
jgi:mannose-6-phosphate isomerase-like protein (cupin superfamily)